MSRAASTITSLFLLGALGACSEDDPNPPGDDGTGAGRVDFEDTTQKPDLEPKKRTVIERNPFGNVEATKNLLWDGDFEWSSPFTDQYGWLELPASPTLSDIVVGPSCRSGIKCARVKKKGDILGIGVGSAMHALSASVWIRFEVPADAEELPVCADAKALVIDAHVFSDADDDIELLPEAEAPDAEGWCRLSGAVPVRKNKPYFLVSNDTYYPMLVDDAVLLAVEVPDGMPDAHPLAAEMTTQATKERIARARAAIAATRLPSDGPPNPAREAMKQSVRQRGVK